jgi:hypothetical protein
MKIRTLAKPRAFRSVSRKWGARLAVWLCFVVVLGVPPARSAENLGSPYVIRATVNPGEKVRIWFRPDYGPHCGSAGLPVFTLTSDPALGKVTEDEVPYTVPTGQNCGGVTYRGLEIWYSAGPNSGEDRFGYTVEFPHESRNPEPSKGPLPGQAVVSVTPSSTTRPSPSP